MQIGRTMSEREEIILNSRFWYSIFCEGLWYEFTKSLGTPSLVLTCDGWQLRKAGCGGTVCDSVSITNDIVGSALSSAFVNASLSVSSPGPRLSGRGTGLLKTRAFLSLSVTRPYMCAFFCGDEVRMEVSFGLRESLGESVGTCLSPSVRTCWYDGHEALTHLQLAPLPMSLAGGLCSLNQDEFGTFDKPSMIETNTSMKIRWTRWSGGDIVSAIRRIY